MLSMAALFVAAPCYGNAFKKAAWVVVPYLKNQALIKAAKEGDVVGVKKALKAKANVNAKEKNRGVTALIYAARNGHNDIVKLLIEAGATVNYTAILRTFGCDMKWYYTALGEAARNGHNAVVETLIKAGADVNASDIFGRTALTYASHNNHDAVVKTLLAAGVVEKAALSI